MDEALRYRKWGALLGAVEVVLVKYKNRLFTDQDVTRLNVDLNLATIYYKPFFLENYGHFNIWTTAKCQYRKKYILFGKLIPTHEFWVDIEAGAFVASFELTKAGVVVEDNAGVAQW